MLNEFKAFIAKGNVLDLAVGIIIGAAFTAIVTSLVDDLIQPLIGLIIGNIDFSTVVLGPFKLGNFITAIIKFLIVAWVVFLIVKGVNKAMPKKEEAPAAPAGPSDNDLLKDILAALKK
jgi:large conductance mechanosensitive channel